MSKIMEKITGVKGVLSESVLFNFGRINRINLIEMLKIIQDSTAKKVSFIK